jgi:pentapeptide MXKDX repeat protein
MWTRRGFVLLAVSALVFASVAHAQDSQSLGDAARQARLQKQQKDAQAKDTSAKDMSAKDAHSKDAHSKDAQASDAVSKNAQPAKPSHVITNHVFTNDEIPSHVGSTVTSPGSQVPNMGYSEPSHGTQKIPAEQWGSLIQQQKDAIASLQREIADLSESIHYAGGNCVANCVQWNERQKEKQDRVETMKAQLEQQQKRLEDMQEAARKQGFGSAVYDP